MMAEEIAARPEGAPASAKETLGGTRKGSMVAIWPNRPAECFVHPQNLQAGNSNA